MKRQRTMIFGTICLALALIVIFLGACGSSAPAASPSPSSAPAPSSAPTVSKTNPAVPLPSPAATSAIKPMEFRYVVWDSNLVKDLGVVALAATQEIEKRTNGAIKFKYLGGSEVVASSDQMDAVSKGVFDVVWLPASYQVGSVPEANVFQITSMDSVNRRAKGIEDLLNEIYHKKNIHYLMNLEPSNYDQNYRLFLNKAIVKPDDLKKLRIRASAGFAPLLDAFGAVRINIAAEDVYTAMERSMIDGYIFPATGMTSYSLQEVTKFYVDPGFGKQGTCFFMNLNVWNTIPAEQKKIIEQAIVDTEKTWAPKYYQSSLAIIDVYSKAGMKPAKLSDEDGKRMANAYYDDGWKDLIKKSPTYGPKLRELFGLPALAK